MEIGFFILIGIAVAVIISRNIHDSNEAVTSVSTAGGMRFKYATLLSHILSGHVDSRIYVETRTYIKAGVSNYGGTTMFYIQQCPGNIVMIDYEVSNNPVSPNFTLHFKFDDRMDQNLMMVKIAERVQERMINTFG